MPDSTTSTCAVPRNHVDLQALQPSPADVAWAANLAGRSLLTGAHARPAGFANMNLPSYSPSLDFPLPAPFRPGRQAIPREVLEGIFAQESNFKQASWHSIEGLGGNPLIADASLQPGGVMVITGKGYGTTNFILLDRSGQVLLDRTVLVVVPRGRDVVTMYRGAERETYSCAPKCERRITLGDGNTYFDAVINESGARNGMATTGSAPSK